MPSVNSRDLINYDLVEVCVCEYFKITKETLFKRTRRSNIVYPRQVYTYLCKKLLPKHLATHELIGERLNQDRTSVIHSITKIENMISIYIFVDKDIRELTKLIKDRVY
jgi:chromosomal replication initiation ATPase DnaA